MFLADARDERKDCGYLRRINEGLRKTGDGGKRLWEKFQNVGGEWVARRDGLVGKWGTMQKA